MCKLNKRGSMGDQTKIKGKIWDYDCKLPRVAIAITFITGVASSSCPMCNHCLYTYAITVWSRADYYYYYFIKHFMDAFQREKTTKEDSRTIERIQDSRVFPSSFTKS